MALIFNEHLFWLFNKGATAILIFYGWILSNILATYYLELQSENDNSCLTHFDFTRKLIEALEFEWNCNKIQKLWFSVKLQSISKLQYAIWRKKPSKEFSSKMGLCKFVLYNRVLFDDFLRNLFCRFVLNQIYGGGDFAKFCGLLRMTPKIMKHNRYFFPFQAFYVFCSGTG